MIRCICDQLVFFFVFYYQDDDLFLEMMESEYNDNNRQDFCEVESSESDISFSDIEEVGEDDIYSEYFQIGWSAKVQGYFTTKTNYYIQQCYPLGNVWQNILKDTY